MKIELNKENDMLSIEGQGEIVLTRLTKENPIGITMKCDGAKSSVSNMYMVNLKGRTRVGRFLSALKHVWVIAK